MSEPWDRQEGEPSLWFDRFERFRKLGPQRTLIAAVQGENAGNGGKKRTKTPGSWDEAAAKWRWRERADAYDRRSAELSREAEERAERTAREAAAKELIERRKAWVAQAQALQAVGSTALLKLQDLVSAEGPEAGVVLSARDVLALLDGGMKLELLARGEPVEITENRNKNDNRPAEQLTDDDLVRIARSGGERAAEAPAGPAEPPAVHDVHEA